jgi:speckle-type POZ protein
LHHVEDDLSIQLSIYETNQEKNTSAVGVEKLPILQDFKRMFEEELLCDIKIQTNDGVIFNAHKAILVARSPVCLKMLTIKMEETATNEVKVEDFDSVTMRKLLRFIYCGEVQDLKENIKDLIYAAEKYEVNQLKEICIDELAKNVSEENVIETLIIADQISGIEKLIKVCVPIIHS